MGLDCSGDGRQLGFLVPYFNNRISACEAQFIIGYRGVIKLAKASGYTIEAKAVFSKDKFDIEFGIDPVLSHIPARGDRGKFEAVYAIVRGDDGSPPRIEYMALSDVEAIMKRSKAGSSGPWKTDFEEMAKKTVIKRAAKQLPDADNLVQAVNAEYDNPVIDIEPIEPSQAETESPKTRTEKLAGSIPETDKQAPEQEVENQEPADTPGPARGNKEQVRRDDIVNMLGIIYDPAPDIIADMLAKYSGFDGKDGRVECNNIDNLKGKWLNSTYRKIKEEFDELEAGK